MAEAILNSIVEESGTRAQWIIDSCGTAAYRAGESPDPRGLAIMEKHGLTTSHIVRKLRPDDFKEFDFILAMDEDNIQKIKEVEPADCRAKICLLGEYDHTGQRIIEDPYHGGPDDYEAVYQQCLRCCKEFHNQMG